MVPLFESLDKLEKILTDNEYLVGGTLTEADIRLWVTIVSSKLSATSLPMIVFKFAQIRFDPVYVGHFKCNFRTIRNGYPAINS